MTVWRKLFTVDPSEWRSELEDIRKSSEQFGAKLPNEPWSEYCALATRLKLSVKFSLRVQ